MRLRLLITNKKQNFRLIFYHRLKTKRVNLLKEELSPRNMLDTLLILTFQTKMHRVSIKVLNPI